MTDLNTKIREAIQGHSPEEIATAMLDANMPTVDLMYHKTIDRSFSVLRAQLDEIQGLLIDQPNMQLILTSLRELKSCCENQEATINLAFPNNGNSRQLVLEALKQRLEDATEIITTDPYLFAESRGEKAIANEDYVKSLIGILPQSLRRITVVADRSKLEDLFRKQLPSDVEYNRIGNAFIHDRTWVRDREIAWLAGGSLNTYGARYSFLVDLHPDLSNLLNYIDSLQTK